jgi:glycosyltransferase involved in cell wall biosynthesis
MSSPKLSICIATHNRAAFIGETLDSLVGQLTDDVELVILDGASTDNTGEIVRAYESRCSRLRYVRQAQNRGVDQDFDRVVELARGEYCWLMTDDDLLSPVAVAAVLAALQDNYSLVVVNAEVRSADMSALVERRRLRFDAPRIYGTQEMDRLFADTGAYLTFIGCVVIRRSLWLQRERATYYGSLFIHVGVIGQRPLPGKSFVINDTLISIRYGNAMWRPKEFEIWMFKWPSLVWSLAGLTPDAKRAVYPAEPWRDLRRLFFFRAKGSYSMTEYRRWIRPRMGSTLGRVAAILVAVFPGPLANALALLYFRILDRDQGLGLADTRNCRFYFRNWLGAGRAN